MTNQPPTTSYSELTGDPTSSRKACPDMDTVTSSPSPESLAKGADETLEFLAPDEQGGLGRLGPYRVLQVLGRGGMGIVFLAEDTALHRQVALKVMRPSMAQKVAARERFLREARATSQIEHDHIVTTYHVGEDRGVPYMAMQLLKGGTLEAWLSQGNRPTLRQAVRIVREAALGLAAAHARALIHRDIKPSNLWLENRNAESGGDGPRAMMVTRVKILDFGLARVANEASNLTRIGTIVGTPSYMSPEQARARDLDGRSDLFSLGCVLYRLCTGALAFTGKDATAILVSLVNHTPCPAPELNPEVPPALADLIDRLLAKDPAARPASARAVAEELQAIERDLAGRGRGGASAPVEEPAPLVLQWKSLHPHLRRGVAAAVGGIALLLLLAIGLFVLWPASGTVLVRASDDSARTVLEKSRIRVVEERTGRAQTITLGAQSLRAGRYKIDPASVPVRLRIEPQSFEVTSRGAVALVVQVIPPANKQ